MLARGKISIIQKKVLNSLAVSSNISKSTSFSTAATIDFVPESIKENVKLSVLEEVTKKDSKLWGTDTSSKRYSKAPLQTNLSSSSSSSVTDKGNNETPHYDHSQDLHHNFSQDGSTINSPMSFSRLHMLDDPLDEWYLDRQPTTTSATTSSAHNNNNNIQHVDPFILSKEDLQHLSANIRNDLIGTDHPVLNKAASYFFEDGHDGGKKVRPMMILLLSRAMSHHASLNYKQRQPQHQEQQEEEEMNTITTSTTSTIPRPLPHQRQDLFHAQRRLAEISEMIHTASLFHDDVIDKASTRRGIPTVHSVFGNKMAILAGDYLLARASVFLARLRNVEVFETMAYIIEHLVRGEVMQMKGVKVVSTTSSSSRSNDVEANERLISYLKKNFYKTASLMANSCKSAAILGGYDDAIVSAAYRYGKHLGIAFQLIDDVLDFDGSTSSMGKPALADLNAGLATAPVLFAAEVYLNDLLPMMERKFRDGGDVEKALEFVRRSDGIQRTKDLARVHAEIAIESVMELQSSVYRDSLVTLAHKVIERSR